MRDWRFPVNYGGNPTSYAQLNATLAERTNMADSVNFADLAQVTVGSVEPPKPLPEGHYLAQFTGPMKQHKAKSGNVAMRFPFKLVGATDDVDQDALSNAGGLPNKEFNLDFWMSPEARYRFTDFGKAMGASDDLNLLELAEWLITENQPFTIQCKQEADSQNPEKFYTRFDNPTSAS